MALNYKCNLRIVFYNLNDGGYSYTLETKDIQLSSGKRDTIHTVRLFQGRVFKLKCIPFTFAGTVIEKT